MAADASLHPVTHEDLCKHVNLFLSACVHQILYSRQLYPRNVFTGAKLYGMPLHMSTNALLNNYVHDSLKGVHQALLQGTITKFVLHVQDAGGHPLERFVFRLSLFADALNMTRGEMERRFSDCIQFLAMQTPAPLPEGEDWELTEDSRALSDSHMQHTGHDHFRRDSTQFAIKPLKHIRCGQVEIQAYIEDYMPRKTTLANERQ